MSLNDRSTLDTLIERSAPKSSQQQQLESSCSNMRPSLVSYSHLSTSLNIATSKKDDVYSKHLLEKIQSKEHYRRIRSAAFRFKRQQMRDLLIAKNILLVNASDLKLAKNKNRQDAARKRVRDQNGKF